MIIEQLDNDYKFIRIFGDDGSCRVLKPSYDVSNESEEVKQLAEAWTEEIKLAWQEKINSLKSE